MRTQDEILARFRAAVPDDYFGFRREVLVEGMDHATLRVALGAEIGADITAPEDIESNARDYFPFAVEKIVYHRSISATRSVDKLREYAWLLGRDDVVSAMDSAAYPQYGAPKVRAFADGMGWPWPELDPDDVAALARMAAGDFCEPTCGQGCGS